MAIICESNFVTSECITTENSPASWPGINSWNPFPPVAGMNMSPVSRLKKTWGKAKTAKFFILEVSTVQLYAEVQDR